MLITICRQLVKNWLVDASPFFEMHRHSYCSKYCNNKKALKSFQSPALPVFCVSKLLFSKNYQRFGLHPILQFHGYQIDTRSEFVLIQIDL